VVVGTGGDHVDLYEARVAAEELDRTGLEQLVPGEAARVAVHLEDFECPGHLVLFEYAKRKKRMLNNYS
jgi:hypothetical protein